MLQLILLRFASYGKRESRGQSAFAQIGQGLMASLIRGLPSYRPRALDQDVEVISGAPSAAIKVGLFGLLES